MPEVKKPKKRVSTSTFKEHLDDIVRDILKLKYPNQCICCGRRTTWFNPKTNRYGLTVGHFISRTFSKIRWDLDNVAPQCSSCNINHNRDTGPYAKWIVKTYGIEKLDELTARKKGTINRQFLYDKQDELLKIYNALLKNENLHN